MHRPVQNTDTGHRNNAGPGVLNDNRTTETRRSRTPCLRGECLCEKNLQVRKKGLVTTPYMCENPKEVKTLIRIHRRKKQIPSF